MSFRVAVAGQKNEFGDRPMRQSSLAMLGAIIASLVAGSPAASAAERSPLAGLEGSWSGSGNARFDGGRSERLSCRGYYTIKRNGQNLGLALRCASASAKIDLRSQVRNAGGHVSGSWEERSFNASGKVSGRASPGQLSLSFTGGGIAGGMTVSYSGSSQSVSINASGSSFRGVSIRLTRK